jgi:hypothetical protein
MKRIDPINDIGNCSQCLEPVQEPARNVDLGAELVIEKDRHHLAKGCRSSPRVDDHVQHGAISAPHQLFARQPRSTVQSSPDGDRGWFPA